MQKFPATLLLFTAILLSAPFSAIADIETAVNIHHNCLAEIDSLTGTLGIVEKDTTLSQRAGDQNELTTKKNQKKKKRVAAICAFPFPLGFMGAHRVMLGTSPWVPVVYVATFGGCFGLLPLIDYCVIMYSKDIAQYENNSNIFMWIK